MPLIAEYLAGGNPPDAPGNLVAWLHTRRPVYGYRLEGDWFDVGDRAQLLEADNWLRRRNGLPERSRVLPLAASSSRAVLVRAAPRRRGASRR